MRYVWVALTFAMVTAQVRAATVADLVATCQMTNEQIRQIEHLAVGLEREVTLNTISYALKQVDSMDTDACFAAVVTDLSHIRTIVGTIPATSVRRLSRNEQSSESTLANIRVDIEGIEALLTGEVPEIVSILEINGQVVTVDTAGRFSQRLYIPDEGVVANVRAIQADGIEELVALEIERDRDATQVRLSPIDPPARTAMNGQSRIALIIGVDQYRDLPTAPYAEKDALSAYQVARNVMGIPARNIKDLVGTKANEVNIKLALRQWLGSQVDPGNTELFIFYSGHGLIDAKGETRYWMPYDAHASLLEDTAIPFQEIVDTVAALDFKSTVIIADSCYTGLTRSSEPLTAQRPVRVQRKQDALPDNMILFAASQSNQTALPLEQAEHGLFSYWVLRGLSGDADLNQDRRLTAGELQDFVKTRVARFSGGTQVPELDGDARKELVRW